MEVLNDRVNPPIRVESKITRSLNHWSTNRYIDPSDDVPFVVEDLSPEELGHIYYWKLTAGRWVIVHMPYKVMDSATGKLVKGLKTYKTLSPYVNGSLPERHLKNPKSCIRHFRLSQEDFRTFSRRVRSIEGDLVKDEVDTDVLSVDIATLSIAIDEFNTRIQEYRTLVSLISSEKYYEKEEDLTGVLNVYRDLRSEASGFTEKEVSIVLRIDKLSNETDKETEKVRINEEFSPLKKKLSEFRSIPFDRFEREAIHKCRVEHGKDTNEHVPVFIRDLSHEINELKAYYPCLSRLRVVNNNEVALDLTGVDVTLTKNGVIVRGDPGALKVYMSENTEAQEEIGSRRVRSIVGSRKSKK